MKAKVTSTLDKRVLLKDALPLEAPFSLYIEPINLCNFNCYFCEHSLKENAITVRDFKKSIMTYELFEKLVEQLKGFNGKIKTIVFAGLGEPLLNKDICKMVALCKKHNICQRTEIITNGSLLTNEISNELISSGIDFLRISVEGLSSEKYKEVTGKSIDFEAFVKNIKYFYDKKNESTKVYIKIMDKLMDKNESEDDFYNLFGSCCDNIAIEHMVPAYKDVDYSNRGNFDEGMTGYKREDIFVCPRPFYMLSVLPDGEVIPCCYGCGSMSLGNIKNSSVKEIWEGDKIRKIRLMMLEKGRFAHHFCKDCNMPVYVQKSEDDLDSAREHLIESYK